MIQPKRRLRAVLAADAAGYSRLKEADEDGTHQRMIRHALARATAHQARHHELELLPDYGSVTFTNCFARTASKPGPQGTWLNLAGARLLRMIERRPDPYRSALISRAEKRGRAKVTTIFQDRP